MFSLSLEKCADRHGPLQEWVALAFWWGLCWAALPEDKCLEDRWVVGSGHRGVLGTPTSLPSTLLPVLKWALNRIRVNPWPPFSFGPLRPAPPCLPIPVGGKSISPVSQAKPSGRPGPISLFQTLHIFVNKSQLSMGLAMCQARR